MYKLYARPGWGSVLAEAQLAWYGLDYDIEDVDDLFASTAAREHLAAVNPLAQIPTLILPDGEVMTEGAAITLHLADTAMSRDLVPAPGEVIRPKFLRWLIFLVANVYPTFTYADDPARFVSADAARQRLPTASTPVGGKGTGGAAPTSRVSRRRFSALDIYLAVMTRGAAPCLLRRNRPALTRSHCALTPNRGSPLCGGAISKW